jgi:hypothetical protein
MDFKKVSKELKDIDDIQIDKIEFQKMVFIHNALKNGWTIKKKQDTFIFTKKHEGKKEVFLDSYLVSFMKTNTDISTLLS